MEGRLMARSKTRVAGFVVGAFCLVALASPCAAQSQIPDKFTNLKVLPKDISKRELMENMKSFTMGLGVRCEHCHVGEAGMPLSEFDFPSDEKEAKRKARAMIQLRDRISDELLPELGALRSHSIQVACVTCHRGQPVPFMLEDVLLEVAENEGTEPAIAKYREYREKYYGGFPTILER